jgi:hypothetical protein
MLRIREYIEDEERLHRRHPEAKDRQFWDPGPCPATDEPSVVEWERWRAHASGVESSELGPEDVSVLSRPAFDDADGVNSWCEPVGYSVMPAGDWLIVVEHLMVEGSLRHGHVTASRTGYEDTSRRRRAASFIPPDCSGMLWMSRGRSTRNIEEQTHGTR